MSCRIGKSKISGQITCPPNKSYTHRAIFLASLAGNGSKVENVLFSEDTNATIDACTSFGAKIKTDKSTITIEDAINTSTKVPVIDTKNSGTTIRIAAGIASLFTDKITLTGDESLQKRPMQPLLDALSSIGAKCNSTNGKPPIEVQGKISGGDVKIPGNLSSQFISSLLIIGPLTEKGINLTIEEGLVSKPYLDATIATMRKFGAAVQTLIPYKKYNITPQVYNNATFTIPIDFSSLALLLSAVVLNGDKVSIKGDIGTLPQGDEVFLDILEQLGVTVNIDDNEINVDTPEKLNGGKFDLSNSPDLLPPLSILSLKTSKPIEVVNVKHARLKETDRISIIAQEISKLGIKVQENEDGMILEPSTKITGAKLNSGNDHRLFMAFCIAGIYVGDCIVTHPESVKVSYPNFIEDMNRLGADIKIEQ